MIKYYPRVSTMAVNPNPAVVAEFAPNGVLRAGINLSNFLLVTGRATRSPACVRVW